MLQPKIIISFAKLLLLLIRKTSLGAGSTWPGHLALKFNSSFVRDILKSSNLKILIVAGTNGKTTTSKLIRFILESNNIRVFQNEEGANLLNGIASTLIKYADLRGRFKNFDVAIFEVDENSLPIVLKHITPNSIIFLNLFRDQLDRYGEVTSISKKWQKSLVKLSGTSIFINGDDPELTFLGNNLNLKVNYFGISEKNMTKKILPHDVDSIHCLICKRKLEYKAIAYSHLGIYYCKKGDFKHPSTQTFEDLQTKYPLQGIYNLYNLNAAFAYTFTLDLSSAKIIEDISKFQPAFGRGEIINYKDRKVFLLLSKNPTGFNQSIEAILQMKDNGKNVLLALNDQIADGRDVSWIWDVDFESLRNSNLTITGDRSYDLGIRMKYASVQFNLFQEKKKAIDYAISNTPQNEILYILPTYTAMLEIRKILLGKKLL